MIKQNNIRQYTIGGIRFNVKIECPLFDFDRTGGSQLFQTPNKHIDDWNLTIDTCHISKTKTWKHIFKGSENFESEIPYKWSVVKSNYLDGIYVEFEEGSQIKSALALINIDEKKIHIELEPFKKQGQLKLDPFFQPLGILIIQYIVHIYGGFIIHASTVSYNSKGYLFSAISGTGKSTMANIWKQYGARVINDDRLLIMPSKKGYQAFNTPMPYYQDISKNITIHKAFLINQSPSNYLKKLPILKGTLGLLTNCMQFQYEENQVQTRLEALQSIATECGVYECGFKPDKDIVELILNEIG
ncbi:hypothetical protein [Carboxylicivirga sp. M1479]|uniref:hypothetical protein n=1 Tax=Carboxylicivirga sp. M1479 TaxID=2594476 RepID=UPI001177E309|nr:hypothetical protein [Carboxylicivirga sp. M1479]TRX63007.1 hypothetical protein FNN09_19180 [Carboxylicivirga sp. M1479]